MSRHYKPHDADIVLGRVGGMRIALAQGFALGTVVVLVAFWMLGIVVFHRHPANALFGAFLLTLLHWLNELVHNYGHFRAARSTGFPMEGVRLGTREGMVLFGTSVYPVNEQELSARVHIRRAIGGPIANAIFGVVGLLALLVLTIVGSHFAWVAIVLVAENLLVFGLGNFVPLGFNDGSTLLHWMRRR